MTKDQLKLLLNQYKENKARLKLRLCEQARILKQLETIKEVSVKSNAVEINSDIHSKNRISDGVGDYAIDIVDKENDLKIKLEALKQEIERLNSKIEEIDIRLDSLRYREKEILIAYYAEGCTYEDIRK